LTRDREVPTRKSENGASSGGIIVSVGGLETTLGGSRENFPETVWSSVLAEPDPSHPGGQAARERFFSMYWRPVYRFIRTAGRASIEDAKDLTQEFFSYFLEGGLLAKYREEKGRFRSFLKGVLRRFLSEARRDGAAQKRGGGKIILSLEVADLEAERLPSGKTEPTPDEIFDRQWARDVLAESLSELRRRLTEEGREQCLRVYETYDLSPPQENRSYAELGRSLGITEHQVKSHLDAARERLEQIVRDRLARGVSSPRELADEMNDLFSG
jgi:RNA polymerase sigma-70 factor (ECF subfamily)